MNVNNTLSALIAIASTHQVLERLFLASVEFAVLALVIAGCVWIGRVNSPRLTALLWVLVLAKPIVSLAIGSPLPVVRLPLPIAEAGEARGSTPLPGQPDTFGVTASDIKQTEASLESENSRRWNGPKGTSGNYGVLFETPAGRQPALNERGSVSSLSASGAEFTKLHASVTSSILFVWVAGVVLFTLRSALDRLRLRRLIAAAHAPRSVLCSRYASIASSLGLRRPPRILETDDLESPALAGTFAPVVMVPSWLVRTKDWGTLDWCLRHELMHWKLLDPVANLIRESAQILFYFHPATWWVGKKWEEAAELACDRAIVNCQSDSEDYAERLYHMLVQIRDRRRIPVGSGLFATRTQIGRRIAALLSVSFKNASGIGGLSQVCVLVLSLVTLAVGGAFAEKQERRENTSEDSTKDLRLADPSQWPSPVGGNAGPQVSGAGAANALRQPKSATFGEGRVVPKSGPTPLPQDDDSIFTVEGRVLGPNGDPVGGARLQLAYPHEANPAKQEAGPFYVSSEPDGRFRFAIRKSRFETSYHAEPWKLARIVAIADGYGFGEVELTTIGDGKDVTLQLAKEIPIQGRILDLEGKPVAGTQIRLQGVKWTPGESLDGYIRAMDEGRPLTIEFKKHRDLASLFDRTIATGTDGRFSVRGIGPEHLVELIVEGQTIEHSWINVMTRVSETVDQPARLRVGRTRPHRAYPANFVHIAAPSRPIAGTVTDAETGLPLSAVTVRGNYSATKTNEAGQFQLLGYPKSAQYSLEVIPDDGQPYFGVRLTLDDRAGVDAFQANIKLLTGTLARGTLTDKATGNPVAGQVEYYPLFPNVYVKRFPEVNWPRSAATIKTDGKFQLPVLPGPGVLAFSASGARASDYASAFVSAEEIARLFQGAGPPYDEGFLTIAVGGQTQSAINQENYHALVLINPDEGTPFLATDIALDAGRKARGTVLDPDGQPLSGVTVIGLTKHPFVSKTLDTAEFELTDLNPLRTRSVLFAHLDKRLGSVLTIRGEVAEPLSVRLQAMGSATGRLVDKDGLPVKEAGLHFYRDRYLGPGGCSTKTNQDGRFRVDGLVPGQKYQGSLPNDITVFRDVIVTPGETKELGDSQAND